MSTLGRAQLVQVLTEFFDTTRGISDDSAAEAAEIANVVIIAGWEQTASVGVLTRTMLAAKFDVELITVMTWIQTYGPDSSDPFPTPDGTRVDRPWWHLRRWQEIWAWRQRHGARR